MGQPADTIWTGRRAVRWLFVSSLLAAGCTGTCCERMGSNSAPPPPGVNVPAQPPQGGYYYTFPNPPMGPQAGPLVPAAPMAVPGGVVPVAPAAVPVAPAAVPLYPPVQAVPGPTGQVPPAATSAVVAYPQAPYPQTINHGGTGPTLAAMLPNLRLHPRPPEGPVEAPREPRPAAEPIPPMAEPTSPRPARPAGRELVPYDPSLRPPARAQEELPVPRPTRTPPKSELPGGPYPGLDSDRPAAPPSRSGGMELPVPPPSSPGQFAPPPPAAPAIELPNRKRAEDELPIPAPPQLPVP